MLTRSFLPRRGAWRALLAGCALATGLSTLAGGRGVGEWIYKVVRAPASATAAGSAALQPAQATGVRVPAALATHERRDAHPFAPGGDDLLPVGEGDSRIGTARAWRDDPASPLAVTTPNAAVLARPTSALPSAPGVLLWLDRPRVAVGERARLYLAASGSDTCRGLGLLDGQTLNNGATDLPPQTAGRHAVGVRCSGPGGTVERSLLLAVPWPVLASSQLNRSLVDFDIDQQPTLRQLGLADSTADVQTAADYLQEGRHSRWVLATGPISAVFVLSRDDSGRWVDRSADLLDAADRRGCTSPAVALTADFNRDGRPDVFVLCQGSAGDRSLLFLSQPDGRYRRLETGAALPVTQAEALDVDGDGWIDVLATEGGGSATLWLRGRAPGVLDYLK